MEDSKLYSTQDIEKLKEKIDSYRETLTTLKMGTSIEDYLFMKNEFEDLKKQIVHLEGLTETIDGKHSMQMKEYEEQVKQLSTHIESLNQAIEEMNQEILTVLNKLLTVENNLPKDNMPKDNSPTDVDDRLVKSNALPSRKLLEKVEQTTVQTPLSSTEPSYKFLQSLAGKAINMNNGIPFTPNDNSIKKQEERHFNQHYFQSINTHPSQIYNGLYRNTTAEPTFHFRNAADMQEIPVNILEPNIVTTPIANDLANTDTSAPTAIDLAENTDASAPTAIDLAENTDASVPPAIDLAENTDASVPTTIDLVENTDASSVIVQEFVHTQTATSPINEANENIELVIEESIEQIAIPDEVSSQTEEVEIKEVVEENQKKEKNSLFFNLFRRRN